MILSKFARSAVGLVGLLVFAVSAAAELDLNTREGAIAANRKIQCSTIDNEEKTYVWHGKAYSRRMGERDRQLFGLLGMNVRKCVTATNDKGEEGYRTLAECGVVSNAEGFSIDHERIAAINAELWGE